MALFIIFYSFRIMNELEKRIFNFCAKKDGLLCRLCTINILPDQKPIKRTKKTRLWQRKHLSSVQK